MIDFDEKKIIEKADKLYALRGELEAVADKVCEAGFDNILLLPQVDLWQHLNHLPI